MIPDRIDNLVAGNMGFGGVRNSGTGWWEAGIEALDVYSDQKVVNLVIDPART